LEAGGYGNTEANALITRETSSLNRRRKEMAWKKVVRYWLGYNADIKQCYVYYSIEGNPAILPLTVTPQEMLALADMFRNEGPVSYGEETGRFMTDAEGIGEGEIVSAPPSTPGADRGGEPT
jgi:hypothetical protein